MMGNGGLVARAPLPGAIPRPAHYTETYRLTQMLLYSDLRKRTFRAAYPSI
jgi:hypothetical protein